MKNLGLLLLLVLLSTCSFAQKKWTLQECLSYAQNNNIEIKQAELSAKISKNNYLQSKLNVLPTISGDASYGFNFGNSINPTTYSFSQSNSQSASLGLNGSLPLFTGLQQINNIGRSKYDQLATQFDYQNVVNNTALSITNLFLQILVNQELQGIAEKQLGISVEQLNRAKKQTTAGTLAESALFEFEAQKARDEASITAAKSNLEIALLTLKIALQLPENENFNVLIPEIKENSMFDLDKESSSSIYQYAVNNQPSVKSAEARVKSAEFTQKIQKGTLSPTLSMSFSLRDNYFNKASQPGNVSYYLADITQSSPIYKDFSSSNPLDNIVGYDRLKVKYDEVKTPVGTQLKNNFSKAVNFNLSIPLFSGWKKMTNIANSKLQYQIAKLSLDASKNRLQQDITRAYANAKAAQESYMANDKSATAARKSFDVYQKRFDVGLANTFELQQARTNLLRAESQLIQAKYTYVLDLKILDFYQGKPISLQ